MKAVKISDRRGTTLLTVVVSIAILSVALTMTTSAFFSASRLTRQAADFARASSFAESVLERVRVQPFESIATSQVTNGLPSLIDARCSIDVKAPEPGLKEITVTCAWTSGEKQRQAAISTIVAKGALR